MCVAGDLHVAWNKREIICSGGFVQMRLQLPEGKLYVVRTRARARVCVCVRKATSGGGRGWYVSPTPSFRSFSQSSTEKVRLPLITQTPLFVYLQMIFNMPLFDLASVIPLSYFWGLGMDTLSLHLRNVLCPWMYTRAFDGRCGAKAGFCHVVAVEYGCFVCMRCERRTFGVRSDFWFSNIFDFR